jgi:CYTH domain-containing protein
MSETSKYARIERERRFLLAACPVELDASGYREIEDLYVAGTHLRLRRICRDSDIEHKLTQKVMIDATRCSITTIYLDEREYTALTTLPGRKLQKRRYRYQDVATTFAIDVYGAGLSGLTLAEVEAASDATLRAIAPPPFRHVEVTNRPEFRGDYLAGPDHGRAMALARRLLAS